MGLADAKPTPPTTTIPATAPVASSAVAGAADVSVPESSEEVLLNNLKLRESGQPLTVCPKQQRRMREAMSLATGAQFLEDVLSLIHISEPTRLLSISYAVFCLKKKKKVQTYASSGIIISH
eukprot:TRINITY_DN2344_c0_g2_i1.p2 TRINITY_DN2344_c0_g2~~TRINITY_DN2344_c0_g2_i1.p2  ORF type:complete len:122 (-),score=32.82 TRINITY_DN2344_c0_g2_i1:19-384(-)